MSNFDFLKGFDDDLWKCGNRIEEQISKYPFGVHSEATAFLEHVVNRLRSSVGLKKSRKPFYNRLDEAYQEDKQKITYKYKNLIYDTYRERNKIHADLSDIEKDQYIVALSLHRNLYYIARKYFEIFGGKEDELKGIAPYKAPELDFSPEELELIEMPDFNDLIEFSYDYCVVCGEPNHSNYSIYCEDCNNLIDNANNFISIRNSFGKDATFTKEDLIEFGIHEGYINSLISSLNKSDLFRVKGRLISFNNSKLDSFIAMIDSYIKVGDLITQFRQDKISPAEIKQTKEYKQGSFRQDPFYQFYKIVNEEIVNKFEYKLVSTEDIQKSVEFTTIPQKDLKRWYGIRLHQYNRNDIDESFAIFNRLMIDDYLDLKRQGIKDTDIERQLDLSREMIEFFPKFYPEFDSEIFEIKKDLVLRLLSNHKSKAQVIEEAGITQKEYNDIINIASPEYEEIVNARKEKLLSYLTTNDLADSCKLTKVTVVDFYRWFDESKISSDFYIKANVIMMDKYLDERRSGKTKSEVCRSIGLKEPVVDMWLKRKNKLFDKFKDDNMKVIVDLILKGFKENKTKKEISEYADVSIDEINRCLLLGERGSKMYAELYAFYESEVIPKHLSRFLDEIKGKSFNKALDSIDLTKDELNLCYESNLEFHDKYLAFKKRKYVEEMLDLKNHDKALNRSNLSQDEYLQLKEEIDEILLHERMEIVKKDILNDSKTDVAARHAGVTVDDIYDWYYIGKDDEIFSEFSQFFYSHYMEPNILNINLLLKRGWSFEKIFRKFKDNFTKKDFEIWQNDGLINREDAFIDITDDNEEESMSLFDSYSYGENSSEYYLSRGRKNSNLYNHMNKKDGDDDELGIKEVFFKQKKLKKSSSIIRKDEKDEEELKNEILGKK